MSTPDFNDLTLPDELIWEAARGIHSHAKVADVAARWGARHGYEQARQLWPEPITDRPPTEADGDADGRVQVLREGSWVLWDWWSVDGHPWLHTPRWQPRQPSLQEQALAALEEVEKRVGDRLGNFDLIRRALEQAGEGK